LSMATSPWGEKEKDRAGTLSRGASGGRGSLGHKLKRKGKGVNSQLGELPTIKKSTTKEDRAGEKNDSRKNGYRGEPKSATSRATDSSTEFSHRKKKRGGRGEILQA